MARSLAIQPRARTPVLIDERGHPLRAQTAHYAADQVGQELAAWYPTLYSADGEWLSERETVLARVHDYVRNNGMINGAVQTQIDNLVGSGLRLSAKPDWSYLGVKDPDISARIEDQIESKFHLWAYDIDRYCDAGRQLTVGGMVAQAVRSVLLSFEAVATGEWLQRPGARYRTAIQMIDPLRLSQPQGQPETERLKGGIRYDAMGAPIAYNFSSRVPSDPYIGATSMMLTWREVPRETPWGRRMVLHVYDQERPGQSRGKGGIVSVLARGRMVDRNERAHLQAAINNAILGTYVTSPMDWRSISQALGGADPDDTLINGYLENRLEFHKDSYVRFGDNRIPHLYPGEEIKHVQASHPHANFDSFERIFHRYMAAGLNMTYEQFSRDYSQTNYSGHRAALLDYWRFITGRRSLIAGEFATQIYALWLEEAMDGGEIELPTGVPDFYEAKCAWCRCEWIGPGRGQIDPLKEANATKVDLSNGLTTLEIEAAERGRDWRELMRQTAQERKYAGELEKEYGLAPGSLTVTGPTPVPQPPDAPDDRPAQRQEPSA